MAVRVLGINSSPHKDGATVSLVKEVLREAESCGAETKLIHLYDYRIKRCLGCLVEDVRKCNPETCTSPPLDDDFKKIVDKILWADAVVLGTPVWWYNIPGILKDLLDRMTSYENTPVKYFDGKVAVLVASAGEDGATSALIPLMITLNHMGFAFPPFSMTYINGKKHISEDREAVSYARRMGRNIVFYAEKLGSHKWW